jgi:pyruvate dehydrogenase E1 component beta subunit
MFAHVPGLSVIMPSSPADAKGLLMTALSSDSPVICLEHRWLYDKSGPVPEDPYYTPLGVGAVVRPGRDVTIVAISHMVLEALQAADALAAEGIEAEVVDPRTLRPLDSGLICRSAARTGRLVIADTGWRSYGVSAEIAARAGEELWGVLKAPIKRVALPDVPTPGSSALEATYYPGPREIVAAVKQCLQAPSTGPGAGLEPRDRKEFEGPF